MTVNELRSKYLEFWKSKQHTIIPSSSLVPQNDPTTLFTSSGMQPMITYLLGEPHPAGQRIADSQKCFRAEDIDEVGDNRHTTMFEMLGNWSLGDYFKKEQLEWIWDFETNELGLDPSRMYATVYSGDTNQTLITPSGEEPLSEDKEAIEILKQFFSKHGIEATYKSFISVDAGAEQGMGDARIFGYSKKNWWSRAGGPDKMPAGEPGGPDSEMFYDLGTPHDPSFGANCHPNCDCGRFVEIGNSVFMQYRKREDGKFEELPKKNIDFGGGLERTLMAIYKGDIFLTPSHQPIIQKIEKLSDHKYGDPATVKHFRIIADHLKAATMLAADGVVPSNKMQGYMMRRLIRRAVASGNELGLHSDFTKEIVSLVQEMYQAQYPEVSQSQIVTVVADEEAKFRKTLGAGLTKFLKLSKNSSQIFISKNINAIAEIAFDFHQSDGIPSDIFIDWVDGFNPLTLDERVAIQDKVAGLIKAHQELSRISSSGMFKGGLAEHSEITTQYHTATHLLHQALRDVLGAHVFQRGSNINAERLRFDFTHDTRLTSAQITQIESIVNEKIKAALPVTMQQVTREEGYAAGSIGLFGEKYPDTVNVYTIGPSPTTVGTGRDLSLPDQMVPRERVYSREFCGGPHVTNTSEIKGIFKIQKDEKIAKDVVRIKAVLT